MILCSDGTRDLIAIRNPLKEIDKVEQGHKIAKRLKRLYPDVRVELDYSTPFELLIASVLASQNTDVNTNRLTPELFRKNRGPAYYLAVDPSDLETDIHKSGFFRQKTKSIRGVCEKLIDEFADEVPRSMAELLTLPGIGRKTATVVLGEAMGIAEGIQSIPIIFA